MAARADIRLRERSLAWGKGAAAWPARIALGLWVLVLAVLAVADVSWTVPALLAATAAVLAVSALAGALSGARLTAELHLASRAAKGAPESGELLVHNASALPVWRAFAQVEVRNPLTAETSSFALPFAVPPYGRVRASFEVESPYCGKLGVSCARVRVTDALGIVTRTRSVAASTQVNVAPVAPALQTRESGARAHDIESFTYAPERSGDDPAETFALREYAPGDSVRRIHWKLTSKLGSVMLRESSFPIYSSLLLMVETAWHEGELTPAMADAQMEACAALMQALVESGVAFELAFLDHASGHVRLVRVVDSAQMWDAIAALLGAERFEAPESSVRSVLEGSCGTVWAHVAYLTGGSMGADAEALIAGGGELTVLRCVESPEAAPQASWRSRSVNELSFAPDTWQAELAGVEL